MKPVNPQDAFAQIVEKMLGRPGVTYPPSELGSSRAFGSNALKVGGKIFVMLDSRERFVAKIPAARVQELASQGLGVPFESGGRKMKEWLALETENQAPWLSLAEEALAFVGRKTD